MMLSSASTNILAERSNVAMFLGQACHARRIHDVVESEFVLLRHFSG